jgi:hypothetical protein
MVETHERMEKAHEAAHHHSNRQVAVLIAVLAAILALTETGGKTAQNTYLANHIEASNLWAFYQAKTIRLTTLKTAAESIDAIGHDAFGPRKDAVEKQVTRWRQIGDRYESEPGPGGDIMKGEGRKELMHRAKAAEATRDRALAKLHMFEYASAAFQLGIVLASAAVITSVVWLAFLGGGLGLIGVALGLLGWFAPTLIHL